MSVKITKVLLLDNVDPTAKEILEKNGIQATLSKEKFTTSELIKTLQNYDGVVVRSATKVTAEIIENCPSLKIIGRAGTGVDNVDISSATKHGIIVMNTPGGNTLSAAEHTCTLICCLSRNVPAADASMKAEKWDRKAFMGHELFGKTLGVIGLGRIGREAAIRMQSFGMTTIGFDPLVSKEEAAQYNIDWMSTDEIWPKADYITVHTPLIPQTKGLLNDVTFAKCKKGVRVINCARGGIIDEDSLLRALESGQCGGAGLDVFVEEPATNFPLVKHPKVVACPHLGASTKEGQSRCGREIAEQFANVAKGTDFFGVLNAPALTQASGFETWISATSSLGKLIRKIFKADPGQFYLELNGGLLAKRGVCLQAAFCAGFMESVNENVNLINASVLAKNIGIEMTCSNKNESKGSFATSCSIQAKNETTSVSFTVSVVDDRSVLIAINDCILAVPVPMMGNMLVFKSSPTYLSDIIGALSKLNVHVTSFSATNLSVDEQWVAMTTAQPLNSHNCEVLKSASLTSIEF